MARRGLALSLVVCLAGTTSRADEPRANLNLLHATVQIRNGSARGSGTVIGSREGQTLILTAAHVVADSTDLLVELHRHNLGSPIASLTEGGGWPRLVRATLVAADPASDVALLEVSGIAPLRHVARVDPDAREPARGETLTSVGIDRILHLTLWKTGVEGQTRVDIGRGGGTRPFTATTRYPEHGRSGGGLFRPDGTLVGVCCGQLKIGDAPRIGVFASTASIRDLLASAGALPGRTTAR